MDSDLRMERAEPFRNAELKARVAHQPPLEEFLAGCAGLRAGYAAQMCNEPSAGPELVFRVVLCATAALVIGTLSWLGFGFPFPTLVRGSDSHAAHR